MPQSIDVTLNPETFAQQMLSRGHRRACLARDGETGELLVSEPSFDALASTVLRNDRDHAEHEAVFFEVGRRTGALLTAFLHKTHRGQGAGGVRHWPYTSVAQLLQDGLRLSRGMGRKSALAGLWWGGGKGIIARQPEAAIDDPNYRRELYRDYGEFISSLRGLYVTAEDVGTTADDMAAVFETTRFVTCVPESVGGSGNPSGATAKGVVCAMEAALQVMSLGNLTGKTIAMQGAGNVASFMVGELLSRDVARLIVTDISKTAIERLLERHPDPRLSVRCTAAADASIFATPCDVFAPNALGGVINPETIPLLSTRLVCGAANNQLLDDVRDAKALAERGILTVPDFVANRMGIVQCANEQYGSLPDDPGITRHFDPMWRESVQAVTQRVLRLAAEEGLTPTGAANALADAASEQPHPLWPDRGHQILRALWAERWHLGAR